MYPNRMLGFPFPNFPLFPPSKNTSTTTQQHDFNDLSILCVSREDQKTTTIDDSSSSSSDHTKKQTTKRKRLFCKESYITCQSNSQLYSTIQVVDEENILIQLNKILDGSIDDNQYFGITVLGNNYNVKKTTHLYRLRSKLEVRRRKRLKGESLELFDLDHILQQVSLHSQNNHFKHHVVNSDSIPYVLKSKIPVIENIPKPEIEIKKEPKEPVPILPKKILPKPIVNQKPSPKQGNTRNTQTQQSLGLPFIGGYNISLPSPLMFFTSSREIPITSQFKPLPSVPFKNTFNTDIQITTQTSSNNEKSTKRQKVETIIPFSQKLLGSTKITDVISTLDIASSSNIVKLFKDITKNNPSTISTIQLCRIKPNFLNQINSLLQRCFWPNINVDKYLEQPDRTIVAMYNHLVIGFGVVTIEGYIHYLVVMPQFRKCGIGSLLVEQLLQCKGSTEFTIHVPLVDKKTISIMKKRFGFNSKAVHKDFFKSLVESPNNNISLAKYQTNITDFFSKENCSDALLMVRSN